MKTKIKLYQVLSIIAFIGVIFMNYLANALPLNGKNTGELSDMYPNLFTPAGFTFSIWGVIYIALLVYVIYQARSLFSSTAIESDSLVLQIAPWFLLSCLCNMAWIVMWHFEYVVISIVVMLGILYSLYKIVSLLYYEERNYALLRRKVPGINFFKIPFGLYFGWIIVATVANATAVLVNFDWDGFGFTPLVWCVVMLIVATLITLITVSRMNNIYIGLSVIWALFGIVYKRFDLLETEPYVLLPYLGIACMVILTLAIIIKISTARKELSIRRVGE